MRVSAYVVAAHAVALWGAGSAQAADLPPADNISGSWKDAPYEQPALWSGPYVGVFIGGGNGDTDITDVYDYDGDPIAKNSISSSAFLTGVNVGYNKQQGNVVFGVEGALGIMNLSGSVTDDDLRPEGAEWNREWGDRERDHRQVSGTYKLSGGLYGELTGRIGYARDNYLLYLKGGAAFVNANLDAHYSGTNWCDDYWTHNCISDRSNFDFANGDLLLGWTLGFGLEYALSNNWSFKAEYQHFDFGSLSYSYSGSTVFKHNSCGNPRGDCVSNIYGDVDADVTLDVVKLGLNYKLQDEHDPLK